MQTFLLDCAFGANQLDLKGQGRRTSENNDHIVQRRRRTQPILNPPEIEVDKTRGREIEH